MVKKRGETTRFPTRIPAASSPALEKLVRPVFDFLIRLYGAAGERRGKTHEHTPTWVKSKVVSGLSLLMVP